MGPPLLGCMGNGYPSKRCLLDGCGKGYVRLWKGKYMPLSDTARQAIYELFLDCSVRTLSRVEEKIGQQNNESQPFHEALIPREIIIPAKFERSWSTSFGQKTVERIARLVVEDFGGVAEGQHVENMQIDSGTLQGIELYREQARSNQLKLGWEETIRYIDENSVLSGETVPIAVNSDLFFTRQGFNSYFSLKTVKPNIDQTMEAKLDLLRLYYGRRNDSDRLGFGLWYNPYGDGESYAWSQAFSVFEMNTDSVVYIGSSFWNELGDGETYDELIEIASSVGETSLEMIQEMITEWIEED